MAGWGRRFAPVPVRREWLSPRMRVQSQGSSGGQGAFRPFGQGSADRDKARRLGCRLAGPAFTLVELLVVIGILSILSAREKGTKAVCLSNLRQSGIGIQVYAYDGDGRIPYGPQAPPFTSPSDFYPSTGAPTSLISLRSGAAVGLGLLLPQQLSNQPKVLFCPGSDEPMDAQAELAKVGVGQAQSGYYYRHGGSTRLFDDPKATGGPDHLKLDNLGDNRRRRGVDRSLQQRESRKY